MTESAELTNVKLIIFAGNLDGETSSALFPASIFRNRFLISSILLLAKSNRDRRRERKSSEVLGRHFPSRESSAAMKIESYGLHHLASVI